MREVLAALNVALAQGRPCALCTVVETRGSTPQKAGASMLVFGDGGQVGTLGGGCVEAEVKNKVLGGDAGPIRLFDFQLDHDYGWDDGLICGGRMRILAESYSPPNEAAARYYQALASRMNQGLGGVEVVLTDANAERVLGSRFLFTESGKLLASLRGEQPPADWRKHWQPESLRPRPHHHAGVVYLPLWPRVRLVIVGGGHVGQAVGDLAAQADFDVWVLDDREAYASAERFPRAQRRIVGDIPRTLGELQQADEFGATTFAIVVTRGHHHDEEALLHLAETACGYVGLIGSRRKIRLIFEDLLGKGVTAEALRRVHAPLGINIGSQTVMEIAISIVAELIAVRNLGQVPASMRERTQREGD